jgi:outer membrane biosynthesis protein TonB
MSDFDRGAYTPQTDQPLTFDARRQRQAGERQPLPLALIFSAVILVALIVALILFYRSGVRGAGDPPQPVGTPVTEMKGPPPPEVQPGETAVGLQVYKAPAPGDAEPMPTFTPGPEVPEARPMAQAQPVAPAQAVKPAPVQTIAVKPQPIMATPQSKATPMAAATKPAPVTKPAPTPAKTVTTDKKPAAKVAVAATSSALVQIGAYSSNDLASKGWSDIAKAFPKPMVGKSKTIVPVEKDGSTLYRTSIGGFGSRSEATAFCEQLKAAGKICIVKGG